MDFEPAERVRAALASDRLDRAPAGWWGHTFRDEWFPEQLAAATVDRQRAYGWDFVKLQPRATCFAEAFGSEYRPSGTDRDPPVLVTARVQGSDDWARIQPVDASRGPLGDQVEALRLVVDELGPSVPVLQTVFSPLTVAGYLVGEERDRVVGELRDQPAPVGNALRAIAETLRDFAGRSLDAGAAGIFFAISGYASRGVLPAAEYEVLAVPHDRTVIDALPEAAWFNVLHLCGSEIEFDLVRSLPSHTVSWSVHQAGNPSLEEGRDRAGRAVMGGVDHTGTLLTGSADDVADEVASAIHSTRGMGVMVAPGCSVSPDAPEDNLRAIVSTVDGEGKP
jgi:uroporphyrinogen decarboxylase